MDPIEYGQTNNGSNLCAESRIRFAFTKTLVDHLPEGVPVFGTCWGFQFINVYFGGSLVQHIDDAESHNAKMNRFDVTPDTLVSSLVQKVPEIYGECYHHQVLGRSSQLKFLICAFVNFYIINFFDIRIETGSRFGYPRINFLKICANDNIDSDFLKISFTSSYFSIN